MTTIIRHKDDYVKVKTYISAILPDYTWKPKNQHKSSLHTILRRIHRGELPLEEFSSHLERGDHKTEIRDGKLFLTHDSNEIFALDAGHLAYRGGNGRPFENPIEYMNIEYQISSSIPLSIYFVPSNTELSRMSSGDVFKYYPKCKRKGIYKVGGSCEHLGYNGGMILQNSDRRQATVSLRTKYLYYFSTKSILQDQPISYYNLTGEMCVVLEPTAGKGGYPGYDSTTGRKIAIDPVTKEYAYLS